MNGSVKDIWDGTDLDNQKEVNKAMKDTMMIISPAIEKVWFLNLKVNILYAVIGFCVVTCGLAATIYAAIK